LGNGEDSGFNDRSPGRQGIAGSDLQQQIGSIPNIVGR
jgi:hypothetical protein